MPIVIFVSLVSTLILDQRNNNGINDTLWNVAMFKHTSDDLVIGFNIKQRVLTLSGPGGGQMSPRFVLYALANLILTLEY